MRASEKLVEALNQQIGNEMLACLQYTSIAAYFDSETLLTLARFYHAQSDEERDHAMKFVHFLMEIGAPVRIPAIPAPKHSFASAEAAVELSLESERKVTGQIFDLMGIARADNDLVAEQFLKWFVDEQQEEENTMENLLAVVRRAGPDRLLDVESFLVREGYTSRGSGHGGPAATTS